MIRRSLSIVVFMCALLASACHGGGSVSPTAPSPSTIPAVDPSKGDLQVTNVVSDKPSDSVLHAGDTWRIDATMYCKPGLLVGILFVREDGERVPYNGVAVCPETVRFIIRPFGGTIGTGNPPTMAFAKGHQVTLQLGLTTSPDDWFANRAEAQDSLHITWRIE